MLSVAMSGKERAQPELFFSAHKVLRHRKLADGVLKNVRVVRLDVRLLERAPVVCRLVSFLPVDSFAGAAVFRTREGF